MPTEIWDGMTSSPRFEAQHRKHDILVVSIKELTEGIWSCSQKWRLLSFDTCTVLVAEVVKSLAINQLTTTQRLAIDTETKSLLLVIVSLFPHHFLKLGAERQA
jgi:hypothetical protein